MISDGAPVDDSTLSVNPGNYLERHLRYVIEEIQTRSPVGAHRHRHRPRRDALLSPRRDHRRCRGTRRRHDREACRTLRGERGPAFPRRTPPQGRRLRLSRRSFLIGGGAVAATPPARALPWRSARRPSGARRDRRGGPAHRPPVPAIRTAPLRRPDVPLRDRPAFDGLGLRRVFRPVAVGERGGDHRARRQCAGAQGAGRDLGRAALGPVGIGALSAHPGQRRPDAALALLRYGELRARRQRRLRRRRAQPCGDPVRAHGHRQHRARHADSRSRRRSGIFRAMAASKRSASRRSARSWAARSSGSPRAGRA